MNERKSLFVEFLREKGKEEFPFSRITQQRGVGWRGFLVQEHHGRVRRAVHQHFSDGQSFWLYACSVVLGFVKIMMVCVVLRMAVECSHSSNYSVFISTFSTTIRRWLWKDYLMKWGLMSLLGYWIRD